MRNQFNFRLVYWEALGCLPDKDRLALYDAICGYALDGTVPKKLVNTQDAIFGLIKQYLDRDIHFSGAKQGRQSSEYKEWRATVFRRDNYTCQMCGKHGGRLNAHHISRYSTDVENRTNIDNGVTLCEACHKSIHKKKGR